MRFSRARYVTLCQQSLVTAAVLAVGVSAAGIKTLDIVPTPAQLAQRPSAAPQAQAPLTNAQRPKPRRTPVEAAPVTPKVKEIKVPVTKAPARTTPERTAPKTQAPKTQAPETQDEHLRDDHAHAERPMRLVAQTDPQDVQGYATVGVTWAPSSTYAEEDLQVEVRTETDKAWTAWSTAAYNPEEGPSRGEDGTGDTLRLGTDPLIVGEVDQVQMRLSTADGSVPDDLKLAVIDPGTGNLQTEAPAIDTAKLGTGNSGEDQAALSAAVFAEEAPEPETPTTTDDASLTGMKVAPKPYIYSRAQWGANEKMRDQSKPSYGTIKAGFIHHTVNANNYTQAQVPSLLRGIYAYHTQSKGWRDVGYNFLVDRFGRIWEGRWGGVDRPVVGAHTLGYNEVAFAMSAIGNFDVTNPPQVVSDAYARLFAWKLSMYNIRGDATRLYVKNRYMAAINGHRDAGQTACPGKYLYAKIPAIRTATQKNQNAAQSGSAPAPTPTPTPTPEADAHADADADPHASSGGLGVHLADPDPPARHQAAADQLPEEHQPRRLGVPRPGAEVQLDRRGQGAAPGRDDRLQPSSGHEGSLVPDEPDGCRR